MGAGSGGCEQTRGPPVDDVDGELGASFCDVELAWCDAISAAAFGAATDARSVAAGDASACATAGSAAAKGRPAEVAVTAGVAGLMAARVVGVGGGGGSELVAAATTGGA